MCIYYCNGKYLVMILMIERMKVHEFIAIFIYDVVDVKIEDV